MSMIHYSNVEPSVVPPQIVLLCKVGVVLLDTVFLTRLTET